MGAGNKIGATVARLAAGDEPLPADGMQLGVLQGASPGRGGAWSHPAPPGELRCSLLYWGAQLCPAPARKHFYF